MGADETYIVWTDGACHNNGRHDALGALGVYSDSVLVSKRLCECQRPHTNNKAELHAILEALSTAPRSADTIVIRTDSELCVKIINKWYYDWRNNGDLNSQGRTPTNWKLICEVMDYIDRFRESDILVTVEHVRGHADDFGNKEAHNLAQRALRAKSGQTLQPGRTLSFC